jgi:hypothetical protein
LLLLSDVFQVHNHPQIAGANVSSQFNDTPDLLTKDYIGPMHGITKVLTPSGNSFKHKTIFINQLNGILKNNTSRWK